MFTFGSLFSGIGGLDLGLERAGMQCVWQVEKDEYCRKILTKHWPTIPKFDDVTTFCTSKNNSKYKCDLIAGGFPCQDVSVAGEKKGVFGERTGLWQEFIRIIGVLRPRFVLMENVPHLLHCGIEHIFGALAEIGYDSEWQIISAAHFGSPHLRERIFILAYPCETFLERIFTDVNRSRLQMQSNGKDSKSREGGLESCRNNGCNIAIRTKGWWSVEPKMDRMVYGISRRMVRPAIKALGNAVVPQVAQWIGEQILKADKTI